MSATQARPAVAALRLLAAAGALAAVAAQLVRSTDSPAFHPANFFSYFTVQSNVIGAAVLLAGAVTLLRGDGASRAWALARGATVVYLGATAVVYALLLRETAVQNAFQLAWADKVLHVAFPLAVVLDWLLVPPRSRPGRAAIGLWLGFPAAWLAYTLVRGSIVGFYPYPYPFLDPAQHGTGAIALACLGVAGFMALLGALVRLAARRARW